MGLSLLSVFSALVAALFFVHSNCSVDTADYEAARYQTLKQALKYVPGDLSSPTTLRNLSMSRLTRDIAQHYIANANVRAVCDPLLDNPRNQIRLNLGEAFGKYMVNAEFRATVDALVDNPVEQVWSDVEMLYLYGSRQLVDISPLAGLKNLKKLDLSHTQVTDITSVAELKNLERLDLSFTQVTDISSLAGLKNLKELSLSNTPVTVIRPLAELENLKKLYLYDTPVIDINSLVNLKDLIIRR